MNAQDYVCQNESCSHFGLRDKNNLTTHSIAEKRLRCKVCKKTFSITKGTGFYRLHKEDTLIITVMTLLAYGCPSMAIVKAFELDPRSLISWQNRFGTSARRLHKTLFHQVLDYCHIQCDELYVKMYAKRLWVATAIEVSTRLWLSVELNRTRTNTFIENLLIGVKSCVKPLTKLYFETDGLASYKSQIAKVFRYKVKGKTRFKYKQWEGLVLVQIIKTYRKKGKRYAFKGLDKIKMSIGTFKEVTAYIKYFKANLVNTAYVERLNATIRGQVAPMVRRSRAIKKDETALKNLLEFKRTVYNLSDYHKSLKVGDKQYTPAMKAGIAKKKIPIRDILNFNDNDKDMSKFTSTV